MAEEASKLKMANFDVQMEEQEDQDHSFLNLDIKVGSKYEVLAKPRYNWSIVTVQSIVNDTTVVVTFNHGQPWRDHPFTVAKENLRQLVVTPVQKRRSFRFLERVEIRTRNDWWEGTIMDWDPFNNLVKVKFLWNQQVVTYPTYRVRPIPRIHRLRRRHLKNIHSHHLN